MGTAKDVAARERATKGVQLRVEGRTYEQIAEALGYSGRASAYNAVMGALNRQETESAAELRKVGGRRLEMVIAEMMPMMTDSSASPEDRVRAAKTVIRAQESFSRLFGLAVDPNGVKQETQLMIVESEVLSNNMAAVLAPDMPRPDLGEIMDVEVDDE